MIYDLLLGGLFCLLFLQEENEWGVLLFIGVFYLVVIITIINFLSLCS